jgi:hypothetical protein
VISLSIPLPNISDFTDKTKYPDIDPNNELMRAQFSGPLNDMQDYIKNVMIPNIADISGWTKSVASFSFASATAPMSVMNTSVDVTAFFYKTVKVKLTQDSTTKYFTVYSSTGTSVSLDGGASFVLSSVPITDVYFSTAFAPYGFPNVPGPILATLQNGWSNPGGDVRPTMYYKNAQNEVTIEGMAKFGTGVIFTLPTGYRPGGALNIPQIDGSGAIVYITIHQDGTVTTVASSANGVNFCCSFLAEQ